MYKERLADDLRHDKLKKHSEQNVEVKLGTVPPCRKVTGINGL